MVGPGQTLGGAYDVDNFCYLGIVSAPLWDSKTSTFAGLLTTSDYINVIQYYWHNPDALAQIDQFRLNNLRGMSSIAAMVLELV